MSDVLTFLYVSFPDAESASNLARILVGDRSVLCVNIFSNGQSLYQWGWGIAEDHETYALFKVFPEKIAEVVEKIKEFHPYDTPAILSWTAEILTQEYADWARGTLKIKT